MQTWPVWTTAAIWFGFLLYWSTTPGMAVAQSAPKAGDSGTDSPGGKKKQPFISIRVVHVARRGDADAVRSESATSRSIHQLLMWASLLVALLPGFWPLNQRFLPPSPLLPLIGLALQIGFGIFYLWCKQILGKNWSGAVTIKADHELVRDGPYRLLRHPLYTGMLGMFAGTVLVWGQWHALAGFVICAVAYARKIVIEERQLRERFGESFDEYRRTTWALVPGLL